MYHNFIQKSLCITQLAAIFTLLISFKILKYQSMKTQALKASSVVEIPTWKLVTKLGLLAAFCMGLCYLFAVGVSSLAAAF